MTGGSPKQRHWWKRPRGNKLINTEKEKNRINEMLMEMLGFPSKPLSRHKHETESDGKIPA